MEKSEIKSRIKRVTGEILGINPSEIADSANFSSDLGASSLQSIRLVAGFEEEFNIEMDEDKALEVSNVSDAVDFIATYL
jgi:acyl carrier protein